MRYRLGQLKIDPRTLDGKAEDLLSLLQKAVRKEIRRRLRRGDIQIRDLTIIRESIDARRKPDVKLVYTVEFECAESLPFDTAVRREYTVPKAAYTGGKSPVIVGFGPCGIFAALILAEAGLEPIVIERGKCVEERIADVERFWTAARSQKGQAEGPAAPDPESNVQFGEGGAGTFSDGKLTTGIKDIRIRKVLEEFVEAGASPQILYKAKPHIGTDRLRRIIPEIRRKIEKLGGEIRFSTKLEALTFCGSRLTGLQVSTPSGSEQIEADRMVLAIGHSARDTFQMLHACGFRMQQKPFSIGVRIEHPQEMINESQYGDPALAAVLGPADYKLSCRCGGGEDGSRGRGVYTFCMCPGGEVINASTEARTSVTNGMSVSRRDSAYANSGLLVDVRPEDFGSAHPLAGIEFQRRYEQLAWENRTDGGMARSTYGDFRAGPDTDPVGNSLPAFASEAILEAMPVFGKRLKGFDREDARLTAVESRSSSPVRVLRDENLQAEGFAGVIPAGEGPGYAGGIMSAAVDGIRAAEQIIADGNSK